MNFEILKNMVENLVTNYKCPFCGGKNMNEQHIDIVGAAGNTVNIDMHCPSCNKHFMAKTELVQMELWTMSQEKIAQIQKAMVALKGKLGWNLEIDIQKTTQKSQKQDYLDEQIIGLQKTLQSDNFSFSDLFSDSNTHD